MTDTLVGLDRIRRVETAAAQTRRGVADRRVVPRSAHAALGAMERDPVAIVEAQNEGRVPELVELRRERMSQSPFTFYRGSAGLMAHDLAEGPSTGVHLVLCGDAHLSNFGFFASPERRLVFDLNDFDEAAAGPWEWDVKRLVTSVVLAAEELGLDEDRIRRHVLATADAYRMGLQRMLRLDALSRFYVSIDRDSVARTLSRQARAPFEAAIAKATRRTSSQAFARMLELDGSGRDRFVNDPPVLVHVPETTEDVVERLFEDYRRTVRPDVALLLSKYALTDVARRVVGVGSVGTRCYVLALTGLDGGHLVLQVKEAGPSVITRQIQPNETTPRTLEPDATDGERVIVHQQILQAVSDPFLGHVETPNRSYYVRQFRDMKGSIDTSKLRPKQFRSYVVGCGLLLARAHAQSPAAHRIGGYLGASGTFDLAVTDWAFAYARQVHEDYRAFTSR